VLDWKDGKIVGLELRMIHWPTTDGSDNAERSDETTQNNLLPDGMCTIVPGTAR
jgi:hypothetical protein